MTFFKTLTTLYPFLFITMLLFINSETLLFIAYLWIIFNYLWICNINSILLPDPIELTFSNTLLLSITTTCLCIYSLTTSIFILNIYLYCTYLLGLLFLFIQIYEYQLLYFYISDSFFTSSFYLITGLHFSHVIIGIVLLSFVFTSLYNIKLFYLNIQLFYWHFVEIIWLVLYIVFYSSFIVHDIVVQVRSSCFMAVSVRWSVIARANTLNRTNHQEPVTPTLRTRLPT